MDRAKNIGQLKIYLDKKVMQYNTPDFIENDPICIPHQFSKKQDIEIAALFSALFSWGLRTTIIRKARYLMQLLDNAPYDFVQHFTERDLRPLRHFRHRTFNFIDLCYFLRFLQQHYQQHDSLETAFFPDHRYVNAKDSLIFFYGYFTQLDNMPNRTKKHVATPLSNAACKRLNMFLRWMIRNDQNGVDFGLWKSIQPANLYCPLDLHVNRVARQLGLISRTQSDWYAVEELTNRLRQLDASDPIKYDFALFGLGVIEGWGKNIPTM